MIKVMHCADIHLDSPFSMRRLDEAQRFRNELRGAFSSMILAAKTSGAELLLISGDLFDCEYVTADTRKWLSGQLASLPECFVFICPGNHDPLNSSSPYRSLKFPENVHIFGEKRERIDIPNTNVSVYGQAFTSSNLTSSPVTGYTGLDGTRINILVCHGDVGNPLSTDGPITRAEIASSGFDYIALGHIHKRSGVQCDGGVHWCYPGCLQGRSFDETGVKGAMLGSIDKGTADMNFVQFSKQKYEIAEVELESGADRIQSINRIRQAIKPYASDTNLRLILKGEASCELFITPSDIGKGPEYPRSIEIIDRTTPYLGFTEIEKTNTLKGIFCTEMLKRIESSVPGSDEYNNNLDALKIGLKALSGGEIVIAEDEN